MSEWLVKLFPNTGKDHLFSGVPGVPGVQARNSGTCGGTPAQALGVCGVPEASSGTPQTPSEPPGVPYIVLKLREEHQEHQEHRENDEVSSCYCVPVPASSRRGPAGCDYSGFDVRDDDKGWIGESPRQTRLRLIHGGRGEG